MPRASFPTRPLYDVTRLGDQDYVRQLLLEYGFWGDTVQGLIEKHKYPTIEIPQLISTGDWRQPSTYEQLWYAINRNIPTAQKINVPAASSIPVGIDWLRPLVDFWQTTIMAEYSHPNYICANVSREAMTALIRIYPELKGVPVGTIEGKLQVIGHVRNCIVYFPDAQHVSRGDERMAFWDLTPRSEFQDGRRAPMGVFTREEWWDFTEVYMLDAN